jgi:hypothetical protein
MEPGAKPAPDLDGPSVHDAPTPQGAKPAETQLDRLKERRRKVRETRDPLQLEIPEYGGELVAAYRVLGWEEMTKLREKGNQMAAANDPEAELKVTMSTIAAACVGFYVRQDDGDLKPLNETVESFGDEPVRYDSRLAEALGIDTDRVWVVIREMFPTDLSIISHLAEISRWMESSRSEDDADF